MMISSSQQCCYPSFYYLLVAACTRLWPLGACVVYDVPHCRVDVLLASDKSLFGREIQINRLSFEQEPLIPNWIGCIAFRCSR